MRWANKKTNLSVSAIQNCISATSRCFSFFILLFFIATPVFSQDKEYNPVWSDSVLVHKTDSAAMAVLKEKAFISMDKAAIYSLQPLKYPSASSFYLLFIAGLLLVALMLRVLFDDFSESMLRGVLSGKEYFLFLRTNKYDSPVPLTYIFLAKNLVLAVLAYLALEKIQPDGPAWFQPGLLLKVMVLVVLFSLVKTIIELLFNWAIGTVNIFKAFVLQQLFIDFTWGLLLLSVCLVGLYNPSFHMRQPMAWFSVFLGIYLVFNTFRSYQLMSNIRINYRLHFFIYICSFKILPVLLLAKYMLLNL